MKDPPGKLSRSALTTAAEVATIVAAVAIIVGIFWR
jgi:hypothetical protein